MLCRLSLWQESVSFWEQFCWGQMLLTLSKVALPSYQHLLALPVCCCAGVCHHAQGKLAASIFMDLTCHLLQT